MLNQFSRTELLIGKEKLEKLASSSIAIFGLGGVGSYVVEGLARAGIGNFVLVDFDKIDITNINRQIFATFKTIDKFKVDVAEKRIKDINPNANVLKYKEFIGRFNEKNTNNENNIEEKTDNININKYVENDIFQKIKNVNYIVDAVDTVTAKLEIIQFAKENNIKVISALGAGNKLDPTKLKLDDIYNTKICPLAKVMRRELKKRNIQSLNVVYSEETPIKVEGDNIGSISYVPSVAGLLICYKIVEDLS